MDFPNFAWLRRGIIVPAILSTHLLLLSFAAASDDDVIRPSVIGGVVSPAGDYPWMGALVSIGGENEDLTDAQFCGCSLIDENWILTAAHCLDGLRVGEIAVAFGNGDLSGENIVVPIDLIVMHPEYFDVLSLDNDMALARLVRPVSNIDPIELNQNEALVAAGQPIRVIGWGMTDTVQNAPDRVSELRQADLSVLDRDWVNSEDILNGGVSERMLPVGSVNPLITSYFGDSGGPMIVSIDGEELLAGVTSWGTGCLISLLPYSIYTDVIPYFNWIDGIVNRDRNMWEQTHGVELSGNEKAYRLARSPESVDSPVVFVDHEGIQTSLMVRPFSSDWKYETSYYDSSDALWRDIDWGFEKGLEVDGSAELLLPVDIERGQILLRTKQVAQIATTAEIVELPFNQVVSGSFGDLKGPLSGGVRAFKISGLEPSLDYRLRLLSEGGALEYYLRSEAIDISEWKTGHIDGRVNLDFFVATGDVVWLYLVPTEVDIEFAVHLGAKEISKLTADSSVVSESLEIGDPRIGESGSYVDTFRVYADKEGTDVFAVVTASFDSAMKLWDTATLEPVGQSNAWGDDSPEFFIFSKSSIEISGVNGLSLQVMNTESDQIGSYDIELYEHVEWRELWLSDEYDFRGFTVRDHTTDTFNDYEYVDRVELIELGSGTRYLQFTGLESFRPVFALRNITDDVIVQEFDSAFCYESTVIEFTAVTGKRYEAIIASSERSLNKNYFLEISETSPPSPYERFSTISSDHESKMEKWIQRMRLIPASSRDLK